MILKLPAEMLLRLGDTKVKYRNVCLSFQFGEGMGLPATILFGEVPPQRAHDVEMTSYGRRCDVILAH